MLQRQAARFPAQSLWQLPNGSLGAETQGFKQQGSPASGGAWGVATVHLDSMSRLAMPNLLEHVAEEGPKKMDAGNKKQKKKKETVKPAKADKKAAEKMDKVDKKEKKKKKPIELLAEKTEEKEMKSVAEKKDKEPRRQHLSKLASSAFVRFGRSKRRQEPGVAAAEARVEPGKRYEVFEGSLQDDGEDEDATVRSSKHGPAVSGERAPLDETGYFAVAALHSHKEMKSFVRRVANEMGIHIVDEGNLDGFVAYYSGEKAVQDMDRLRKEMKAIVAKRGMWMIKNGDEAAESEFKQQKRMSPPR